MLPWRGTYLNPGHLDTQDNQYGIFAALRKCTQVQQTVQQHNFIPPCAVTMTAKF
jgi:hypothetical protein